MMEDETDRRLMVILEDDPDRSAAMREALRASAPELETLFFDNAPEMVEWLKANMRRVCLLSLDHDLGTYRDRDGERFDPGIGRDVTNYLETQHPSCTVLIHSSNGPAADGMMFALQHAGWPVERVYPYLDLTWVGRDWIHRVAEWVLSDA